jgi:hypothetical protein
MFFNNNFHDFRLPLSHHALGLKAKSRANEQEVFQDAHYLNAFSFDQFASSSIYQVQRLSGWVSSSTCERFFHFSLMCRCRSLY